MLGSLSRLSGRLGFRRSVSQKCGRTSSAGQPCNRPLPQIARSLGHAMTPLPDRICLHHDPLTGVEAIRARFAGHAYDLHRHDDWLVGVTDIGVQDFMCRGRVAAARRARLPYRATGCSAAIWMRTRSHLDCRATHRNNMTGMRVRRVALPIACSICHAHGWSPV
jgi:hypothetical protein